MAKKIAKPVDVCEIKSVVPDGKSGPWEVVRSAPSKLDATMENLRSMRLGMLPMKVGETYTRLLRNGQVIMSDTPDELSHLRYVRSYAGAGNAIIILGLGLGLALQASQVPEMKRVVVVEKDPDVIKLVAPHFAQDPRITIVQGDAFTFHPVAAGVLAKGCKFDFAWHDIWDNICEDNLPEMTKLRRRYSRWALHQECWQEPVLRRMARRSRSYYY